MPVNNVQKITQLVKKEAHRYGFQLVGVTSPDPPPHLDVFSKWLQANYHAGMAWMATDRAQSRRANPLEILPECKSVLVLGALYQRPTVTSESNQKRIKIASYAVGNDYHDILKPKLLGIVSFLESITGKQIQNRWYTDTGPILEREFAQRAGLGWIGKNSCLINPEIGSYILLAEIFLGIKLEFDQPVVKDYCGTCTKCVDQCPTKCIKDTRLIDSNRCISYLTIENKGFIPKDLRALIGTWIFGCDICQIHCPWNQKKVDKESKTSSLSLFDPGFLPAKGFESIDLIEELNLSQEDFNHKFSNSPIKRTKRRGYLRNIAVALGNIGEIRAVPSLVKVLFDPEPLIRGHAAWALGQIGGNIATQNLQKAWSTENHLQVKSEISAALNQCHP